MPHNVAPVPVVTDSHHGDIPKVRTWTFARTPR